MTQSSPEDFEARSFPREASASQEDPGLAGFVERARKLFPWLEDAPDELFTVAFNQAAENPNPYGRALTACELEGRQVGLLLALYPRYGISSEFGGGF